MAWVDTGFRRTLKLQIHKTEANPSISGFPSTGITYTIDGNTTQFTGETLTPYSWTNGLTMGQAPLAEFQARATATENWVKARFPIQATSGITWSNMRVGALATIEFYNTYETDTSYFVRLLNENDHPLIASETIRIEVNVKINTEVGLRTYAVYHYIEKGGNTAEIDCSFLNGNTGSMNDIIDFPFGSLSEVVTLSNVTRPGNVTIDTPFNGDDIIENQNVYDVVFNLVYGA